MSAADDWAGRVISERARLDQEAELDAILAHWEPQLAKPLPLRAGRRPTSTLSLKGNEGPLSSLSLLRRGDSPYSPGELDALMKSAPPMTYPWPDDARSTQFLEAFETLTAYRLQGRSVRFFMSGARVHGDDTVPFLHELWSLAPTRTNLLADLRCNRPRIVGVSATHVDCTDYRGHYAYHRRTGDGWACQACTK